MNSKFVRSNLAQIPTWMKHGLKPRNSMGSFGRIENGNRIGNGNDAPEPIPWQVILNVN